MVLRRLKCKNYSEIKSKELTNKLKSVSKIFLVNNWNIYDTALIILKPFLSIALICHRNKLQNIYKDLNSIIALK